MLNNKSILITGATGSFGQQFIKVVLKKYKKIKRLVIFSRDEFKQYILQKEYDQKKYPFTLTAKSQRSKHIHLTSHLVLHHR